MRHAVDALRPDDRDGHPRPGRRQPTPTGCCSSPTAASSTRWPSPSADRVLDRMKAVREPDMWSRPSCQGMWSHKRRLLGTTHRRRARRRLPRRHARRSATPCSAGFDDAVHRGQRRHRRRRAQRHRDRQRPTTASRGTARRLDSSTRSPPSPGVRRRRAVVEGIGPASSAPTARRIGGDGPPTIGGNWIDDPALNPYHLAEGRAPRPGQPTRSSSTAASADDGDLARRRPTTVLTPEPRRRRRSSASPRSATPTASARRRYTGVHRLPQASALLARRARRDLVDPRRRRPTASSRDDAAATTIAAAAAGPASRRSPAPS